MAIKARHIALIIETSQPHGMSQLRGIRRYMAEHTAWSVFFPEEYLDLDISSWLAESHSDGILIETNSQSVFNAVSEAHLPTVGLRRAQFKQSLPFVANDNQAAGRMVAKYLLERKFRNFGVFCVDSEEDSQQRYASFLTSIREAGCECEVHACGLMKENLELSKEQQNKLADWVTSLQKPVALMACNDQLGDWLLKACRQAEVTVPGEVAVVGIGNEESLCTTTTPPLSSLQFNDERAGYEAAALLDRLMDDGVSNSKAQMFIRPKEVVTRESSDVVAIDDPEIAAALQFIRENACTGISLENVLLAVPISRSSLERGMKKMLGRTPQVEINRIRLNRVKELLSQTDLTLDEIAQETAFTHPQYLSEVFKKKFNITPGVFRRQAQSTEC